MAREIQLMKIGERRPPAAVPPVPVPLPIAAPAAAPVSFPTPSAPAQSGRGFRFILQILILVVVCVVSWFMIQWAQTADDVSRIRMEAELARSQRAIARLKRDKENDAMELERLKSNPPEPSIANFALTNLRGKVTGKTNPPGSTLSVVGAGSVKSPGIVSDVRVGKRILWVTLDGYEPLEMDILVDDQQTLDVGTIQLTQRPGRLSVICDAADAELLLQKTGGGDGVDASPLRMPVPTRELTQGTYELTVKMGGKEVKQKLEILPNITSQVLCTVKSDGMIALENVSIPIRGMAQEEADMTSPSRPDDPPWKLTQVESRLIIQARSAFSARDAEGAATRYEQVLKTRPKSILALTGLAVIRVAQKRYEESEALLRRALSVDEGDSFCLATLGISLYSQQRYDEAVAVINRALARKPDSPLCQNFLGIISLRRGEMVTAEQALLKAIALKPNYADAHFNLALYYSQQKPPLAELARKHYKKARELGSPRDPQLEDSLNF